MNKRTLVIVFALLLVALLTAQCSPTSSAPAATTAPAKDSGAALDGKALVTERCAACHSLDRVTSAKKTADQWKTTVDRMVGKGAKLNADEQAAAIQYLADTYK